MEDNDWNDITRGKMEAGPSVVMEESVAGKSRLGCMQQKHSIFLSHSSAQKAFVRRLQHALQRNAYLPFFDEDPSCLPKGELFAQRIKDASRQTDVAVVVLSDDFFKSKWPMIELAIFIEEQRRRISMPECKELKILPLFMGLSVEDFRNADLQISWLNKWCELGAIDSRIDVSKWAEALKVLGGTNGLEYYCYKNEEEYIDGIVSAIFKLVTPDLKWEDTRMKGKTKFHQAVAGMFARSASRTRFYNVRAIGLYGVGGIGKTTICKSLCNDYNAQFNGKVWHAELGTKSAEEIQRDVLRHLVGISETLLNQTMKCKDQWRSLLRRKMECKVFLAIDNVWNEDISREQAVAFLEMGFHPDSLVIITSRSRELLEWLGIYKDCCFEMPMLDKGDATALLFESAAPGCDIQSITDYQRVVVDEVVQRCFLTKGPISGLGSEKQYVPLALEVLGRQLRLPLCETPAKLAKWVNNLDLKRPNQKQHPIFSILRLSYDNLPSSKHKTIFFDVALCVPRQHDNTSTSVDEVCKWLSMVYSEDVDAILEVLEDLKRDGLVERWQDLTSPFGMHELYCEFVKAEVAKEDNFDEQHYLYHEDGLRVPAIMRMFPRHNYWPLRRIHIYNGGFRELSNRELQYMVNVEVLKLDFCFELELLNLHCLKSLQSVELRGCFSLQMVEGMEDLHRLKFFRWNTCRNSIAELHFPQALEVVEIYGSKQSEVLDIGLFGGCVGMLELTLSQHPLLAVVPDLHKLQKLERVDFSGCCKIEEVRGLEGLCHLKDLNLQNCKRLHHCNGLENLVEIATLNLGGCKTLQLSEVWDLTRLINLRNINIAGNLVVQRLVLGSPQLEQLEVMGCKNLKTVALSTDHGSWKFLNRLNELRMGEPVESRQWTVDCQSVVDRNMFEAFEILNLSNCHTLESLEDIGSLRSLQYLYLQNCNKLRALPDLSNSPHLKVVDLSYSCLLKDLGDTGPLKALQYLCLKNCRSLRSLRNLYSPCLKVLDLSRCSNLMHLSSSSNFDSLRSLQTLNLNDCVSLKTLPNLIHSPLLKELNVKGCVNLIALSQMSTRKVIIDISECSSLLKIPFLNHIRRLELDVTVGGTGPVVENWDLSQGIQRLKLTCERYSEQYSNVNEKVWKDWVKAGSSLARPPGIPEILKFLHVGENEDDSEWREYIFEHRYLVMEPRAISFVPARYGNDVSHFKDMHRLLNLEEWALRGNGYDVKFSSVSISSETLTELPTSSFFSNLSSLKITKCRRLRCLSNINYLHALETLVISQCEELESLPDLRRVTSLKHLTIRDFRQGPKFQFLSLMCELARAHKKIRGSQSYNFEKLIELNLVRCVGLGHLQHWGPLPALESLFIKDCNTINQLPDLRSSSKLSSVIVMNCGHFRGDLDNGPPQALRVVRIEGCGNGKFTSLSSRKNLCSELENVLSGFGDEDMVLELIGWLEGSKGDIYHLDMFRGFNFSMFQFTGQTLETFNDLMTKWASRFH